MTTWQALLAEACVGLKDEIDSALTDAGLETLALMVQEADDPKAARAEWPRCVVSLLGAREHSGLVIGDDSGPTLSSVDVTFTVHTEGTQDNALEYEGVLAEVVRASSSDISSELPEAALLDRWQLIGGDLSRPDGRVNTSRTSWAASVVVRADVQW